MKNHNIYNLLLATVFLTGCGNNNESTQTAATGTSAPPPTTNGTSTQKPPASSSPSATSKQTNSVVTPAQIQQTIALELKNPETSAAAQQLQAAFAKIKDATSETATTMSQDEKKQYILDFYAYLNTENDLFSRLSPSMLHLYQALPERAPKTNASWTEMQQLASSLEPIAEQLSAQPIRKTTQAALSTQPPEKLLYPEALYNYTPTTDEEKELATINDTQDNLYKQALASSEYQRYLDYYHGPKRSETPVTQWAQQKLAAMNFNLPPEMTTLWDGKGVSMDVATTVIADGILQSNFYWNHSSPTTVEFNSTLFHINNAYGTSSQKLAIEKEKEVISALLKTGQFTGLFDYLRDKKFDVEGAGTVIFPASEFDALTPGTSSLLAGTTMTTYKARRGMNGIDASMLTLNGTQGEKTHHNIPLYINIQGEVSNHKTTPNLSFSTAYTLNDTTVALKHSYANTGSGFKDTSRQHELNVAITQAWGDIFVEGGLGSLRADQVHGQNWTGTQYHLALGVDTPYFTPYVQVLQRDLNRRSDAGYYAGLDVHLDKLRADAYTFDVSANLNIGYQTHKGQVLGLQLNGTLCLIEGTQLSTRLNLESDATTQASLNISIER